MRKHHVSFSVLKWRIRSKTWLYYINVYNWLCDSIIEETKHRRVRSIVISNKSLLQIPYQQLNDFESRWITKQKQCTQSKRDYESVHLFFFTIVTSWSESGCSLNVHFQKFQWDPITILNCPKKLFLFVPVFRTIM